MSRTMRMGAALAAMAIGAVAGADAAWSDDLAAPEKVRAAGTDLSTDVGHAAPWVADWDGDGKADLLVGQMGQGHLRIYRNTGSARAPAFEGFEVFRAGEAEGTVPTG